MNVIRGGIRKSLPTAQQVHIDAALTNISVAFMQAPSQFVYDKVFPIVPVQKQSDKYFIFDRADTYRDSSKIRAPGTSAPRIGYRLSNDSYFCDEYALAQELPDPVRANADASVDLERAGTITLTQSMMIGAEQNWVNSFFKTGVWATNKAGGTDFPYWDDFTTSDPLEDITAAREQIKQTTGYDANRIVMGYKVYQRLKLHPLILERTKYTSADSITLAVLARYFEVDQIHVAGAVKTTSAEGAANSTFDFIAGNDVLVMYVPPAAGIMTPAAGYTFTWAGYTGLNNLGIAMRQFRIEDRKVDVMEASFCYDQKLVTSAFGYFLDNVLSF
jgi:hypothetical protein